MPHSISKDVAVKLVLVSGKVADELLIIDVEESI